MKNRFIFWVGVGSSFVVALLSMGIAAWVVFKQEPEREDAILLKGARRFCGFLEETQQLPDYMMSSCIVELYKPMTTFSRAERTKTWGPPKPVLTPSD